MMINKVILYTNKLTKLKEFYGELLGFDLIEQGDHFCEIRIGQSRLEFQQITSQTSPFYHFAFNIPVNHFRKAKMWAKSKVELSEEDGKDEVYFTHSNARAFYFNDPSGNIVEFTSRFGVSPASLSRSFSPNEVLNISEINLTTEDVLETGSKLMEKGIPSRNDEPLQQDALNFMGDYKEGVFLLLGPPKRRWIFSKQKAETYPLSVTIDHHKRIDVNSNGEIEIHSLKSY